MMTCAERQRRIRMMNLMQEMHERGSNRVEKTEDGTMRYYDSNGNVMIEARMEKRA